MIQRNRPLVSIVVPTRNRARTLRYCLETAVSQSYENLQIVVSDNHSTDDTAAVASSFGDSRITYVRADRDLTMNDSYNFALAAARGDYVTFIGDDDGLLPGAIECGVRLLADGAYSALTWRKIEYHWPDHREPSLSNIMHGRSEPLVFAVNGMRKLRLFVALKESYNSLPCLYNSIVAMRCIEDVRSNVADSRLFGGLIPDVHSGIALSPFVGRYLQAFFPLTVNGASGKSSGVLQGAVGRTPEEEELIKDISLGALNTGYHPDIGRSPSVVSIAFGEYLIAQSRIRSVKWPRPGWRAYVKAVVREATHSPHRESLLASARHTVQRRGLWMGVPARRRRTIGTVGIAPANTFQGQLTLPTELVSNVHQACTLIGSLVPTAVRIESSPVLYLARRWLNLSARSAVDVYRALRSRA